MKTIRVVFRKVRDGESAGIGSTAYVAVHLSSSYPILIRRHIRPPSRSATRARVLTPSACELGLQREGWAVNHILNQEMVV